MQPFIQFIQLQNNGVTHRLVTCRPWFISGIEWTAHSCCGPAATYKTDIDASRYSNSGNGRIECFSLVKYAGFVCELRSCVPCLPDVPRFCPPRSLYSSSPFFLLSFCPHVNSECLWCSLCAYRSIIHIKGTNPPLKWIRTYDVWLFPCILRPTTKIRGKKIAHSNSFCFTEAIQVVFRTEDAAHGCVILWLTCFADWRSDLNKCHTSDPSSKTCWGSRDKDQNEALRLRGSDARGGRSDP